MKPTVSILIPTLNAQKTLIVCLDSISKQNYPKELVQIIIADGSSKDNTVEIAKRYGAVIVDNPLKTAEAGKVCALKASTGEYVALIDSDNILPTSDWLTEMINPLMEHKDCVGSEPWEYTYRDTDGFITRYCALTGVNDPLVLFLGNYDRKNMLTGKWTEIPHEEEDFNNYLICKFDKRGIPTIGANGTVFRASFLKDRVKGNYLFDIDILAKEVNVDGSVKFIKVKNGIIHTYCESSILKFARKQKRRVNDYLYHKSIKNRDYAWDNKEFKYGIVKFVIYCVTILPLFYEALKGYFKKADSAWLFHPLACEITLWEYSKGVILGTLSKKESSRNTWSQ